MLERLYYLLLGAITGFCIGIVPFFVACAFSNGPYTIGVLIAFILVGAVSSVTLGKKYELIWDALMGLLPFDLLGFLDN